MIEITNELLIKLILAITAFTISFQVLTKSFNDKKIAAIISSCISVLSVYYLSKGQELFVGGAYGTLGVILLISLPSFIVFFFLYVIVSQSTIRRIGLVFYGVVLIFLLEKSSSLSLENKSLAIVFLVIAIGIILLFDKKIREIVNTNRQLRHRRR